MLDGARRRPALARDHDRRANMLYALSSARFAPRVYGENSLMADGFSRFPHARGSRSMTDSNAVFL